MLIYLAWCEDLVKLNVVRQWNMRSIFFSYYWLKWKTPLFTHKALMTAKKYCDNVIIDSGAHSFFSEQAEAWLSVSVHKKKTKTKWTPQQYFNWYLRWIKNYRKYFNHFVELDIWEIVWQDVVEKWRKDLAPYMKQCITVYHPNVMNWDKYIEMLETSESWYIALEWDRPWQKRLPYHKLLNEAIKRWIKVHWFAQTKKIVMKNYPFYSVDSSSWLSWVQYWTANHLHKWKIVSLKYKSEDWFMLKTWQGYIKSIRHQQQSRLAEAVKAYNFMEKYYTSLWKARWVDWDKIILNFKNKEWQTKSS